MTDADIFAAGMVVYAAIWCLLARSSLRHGDRLAFYAQLTITQVWLVGVIVLVAMPS